MNQSLLFNMTDIDKEECFKGDKINNKKAEKMTKAKKMWWYQDDSMCRCQGWVSWENNISATKRIEFYRFATKQPHSCSLSDLFCYSRSFWLTPAHSDSLWLSRALSGTHRLTRSLLSSLRRSCVALVYSALVGSLAPKVLLDYLQPKITIHPSIPSVRPSTYSFEDDLFTEYVI